MKRNQMSVGNGVENYIKYAMIVLIIALAGLTAFLVWQAEQSETEPIFIFTYAENQPEDYPTTQGAKRFAELVEERTNGAIRIIVHSGAALGTEAEVIQQLKYGGVDFARVSLSQLSEYIPKMNVLQMPYLYRDSEHMWSVLDGEIGAEFIDIVRDYELVGLSWYDAGARSFYNSVKPITCLEDIRGMRIRVQESELMADMVEALGASAWKIPYGDVYASLERGTVDGAENNWPSYVSMSHNEVAQYWTVDEHTRVPEMQLCAEHTWEKLSEEYQQIILECAKASSLYERELWKERETQAREEAVKSGVQIVEFSAEEKQRFREAMADVYEKYCGEYMETINKIIAEGKETKVTEKGVTNHGIFKRRKEEKTIFVQLRRIYHEWYAGIVNRFASAVYS